MLDAAAPAELEFNISRLMSRSHVHKMCDCILMELRRAAFALADFTLHRKGVYFEAGFAMALGIPVVFACRSDQLEDAYFDTRQTNHIVWEDPPTLGVLGLARRHKLTMYDASHLELSQRELPDITTLDRDLLRAAKAEGVSLLGETPRARSKRR